MVDVPSDVSYEDIVDQQIEDMQENNAELDTATDSLIEQIQEVEKDVPKIKK